MNKSELIDAMAADAGISKASAKKALESFLGSVSSTLQGGGRVSLVGFGSWSVSQRAARDGRNPQTGATIKIPAKKVVKFNIHNCMGSTAGFINGVNHGIKRAFRCMHNFCMHRSSSN